MRKLLSANITRLWKEKLFWLVLGFMAIGSAGFSWLTYETAMKNTDMQFYVEDLIFNMLPMLGSVFVIFIGMHLGTEFDEHTIRNKLIVGYNRTQVYFAEYITCLAASLILLAVMLLASGTSGYFLFREFQYGWSEIAFMVFCCVLITAVLSAMIVGICFNTNSRAISLIASFVFLFAIMLLASFCINALAEAPTTYSDIRITMDGVQLGEMIDNPAYIDGTQRAIYELIADILPTGQSIQLNNLECERADRWPMLSGIMLLIVTILGYIPFRKRDVK